MHRSIAGLYEDLEDRHLQPLWTQNERLMGLEYVNPLTGASAFPTLGCAMHRLIPGGRTPSVRRVGSSVFVAFRGAGTTVIDSQSFAWEAGDMFAVPSWAKVDHEASEVSDLFTISDAPVMRALRNPEVWLRPGQEVRCTIEGIGELRNTCQRGATGE
ncbi:hypothetical protein BH23ACT9_BH23ACT9_17160 [soil metagenome]